MHAGVIASSSPLDSEGGGGVFNDPTDIANLALWLDATAITGVSDGGTLSSWGDGSGNNADAAPLNGSPTYETNEINTLPVVRFGTSGQPDASSMSGTLAAALSATATIFIVVKKLGVTTSSHTFDLGITGTPRIALRIGTSDWFIRNNAGTSVTLAATGVADGNAHIADLTLNLAIGLGVVARIDGTQVDSDTLSGTIPVDDYGLNVNVQRPQFIGEIVVYSTALGSTDRDDVYGYLADKWGVV